MLLVPAGTTCILANAVATTGDILYRMGLDDASSVMYGWSYLERLKEMEEQDELHYRRPGPFQG